MTVLIYRKIKLLLISWFYDGVTDFEIAGIFLIMIRFIFEIGS